MFVHKMFCSFVRYPPSFYLCTLHPKDVYYICVSYIFMGGEGAGEGGRGEWSVGSLMHEGKATHGSGDAGT